MQSDNSIATRQGLLLAAISIGISLVSILLGFATKPMANLMMFIPMIAVCVYFVHVAITQVRDWNYGGSITYNKAFMTGFITLIVAGVLLSIFNVLIQFMMPELIEQSIEASADMMEKMGLSQEEIDEAIDRMRESQNSLSARLFGFLGQLFFYAVISAIFAAIMAAVVKKNKNAIA